jgi:uncharacterized protein YndB with AHSA1/START domain
MTLRGLAVLAAAIFAPVYANADVVDSAANGFTLKIALAVQSTPADVYKHLVHNVGDWWSSAHTFSGDAHNLSIDDNAGGCFCEKLADGGGVQHMVVVNAQPGKRLVMRGALGPLQTMGADGSMAIVLSPDSAGTKMEVTFAAGGYMAAGMDKLAAPVNMVLTEQFTRLKNYVEHGNPTPK